jgi:hypothetical protein
MKIAVVQFRSDNKMAENSFSSAQHNVVASGGVSVRF